MADKPWKAFERSTASMFGVKRRLRKGTSEAADIGGDDFPLLVNTKLRKSFRPHQWMSEVREDSVREGRGRPPVLVTRQPPHLRRYALCDEVWFMGILLQAKADHLFMTSRYRGKRWLLADWFQKAQDCAGASNKIALLIIGTPREPNTAVVEAHVLVSVLKSAKILAPAGKSGSAI